MNHQPSIGVWDADEPEKENKTNAITSKDWSHLEWIYLRMVHVHSENPDVDYMVLFREIIDKLEK